MGLSAVQNVFVRTKLKIKTVGTVVYTCRSFEKTASAGVHSSVLAREMLP